ncbi:hypothetical protein C6990_03355 [Nitrosopumilus sp. b3]|uniref:hypothetical protein n=1 Tax=Nitrosopumilus sp. b3 TaxID=2109909 RepID=UPI0015F3A5C5|nr:hypothetical protein [Nitrosopumilus sp. b3]KAF6247505.1 hypothetical protein C6990_03355 [Nitrosopumilus sp. b3]
MKSGDHTESRICDLFKDFFNSFKVDNVYKYVVLIDGIRASDTPVEIDYNDFNDELKKIFSVYRKDNVHRNLYRAIKEVLQVSIGSSVDGLVHENRIKFTIVNHDRFSGVFEKPQTLNESPIIKLDKDKDEKIPSTVKVFNVGKTLIRKQVKSENDTEQIVIKVELNEKPHWIDIFSPTFQQLIRVKTQNIYEEIYAESTYKAGITNLHAYALLNGTKTKPVFSRSAFVDDCLYYDLQNQNGDVYRVSKNEITKTQNDDDGSPIFLKSPSAKTIQSMQQEPTFDNQNVLDDFVKLCRIQEQDKIVFVSHLIAFFLKGFPIPIQVLHGEQGSAKTSVSGAIKSIVDPEGENALSLPEKIDDLAVALSKRDLSNFDNTDNFTKEISQFLCRVVTGTLYPKRKHYTNADEFSLTLMSKIILNGIDPSINQPDLLERSIFYELPKIEKTERMTDEKFSRKIDELRPDLLGFIFSTIQKAMGIVDKVEKELDGSSLPRMATFAIWGESISRALGNQDNKFINRYWEKIDDSNLNLNEEYPLIPLLLDMMRKNCKLDENKKPVIQVKQTSLTLMFNDLCLDEHGNIKKNSGLPENVKELGKQMKQLTPLLRGFGFEITVSRYDKRDGDFTRGSKIVTITPISDVGLDGFE